ncbi:MULTISPECIES: efflux RND transporter periplasmic adaptor subunit [Hyphobacterium]|uniref:Efflux RND transporter periplasmic adaptor subunit n=1 Tax=Hyphobacterium vulgare TaxID=1736751 RepID=A0ABV6ZZZ3_9PROT
MDRGNISDIVPAIGTIRPAASVEVGAEISGRVAEILVDFDDPVQEGQLLARLDPGPWEAALEREESALAVARADLTAARARSARLRAELNRTLELHERGVATQSRLDDLQLEHDEALAQADRAEALVASAQARVRDAEINRARTEIRAPIDGFVLERRVETGQSVNAALSTPVLFVVAASLDAVVIEARVAEADVGRIEEGMEVRFRVDAFPNAYFTGTSGPVRRAPERQGRFVSYPVLIEASDPYQRLLPGMTASVEFVNAEAREVTRIPVQALYAMMSDWSPTFTDEEIAEINALQDAYGYPRVPEDPRGRRAALIGARAAQLIIAGEQDVFVRTPDGPEPYEVRIIRVGAEDNDFVEIVEGDLEPGDEVILRDHLDYDWGAVN